MAIWRVRVLAVVLLLLVPGVVGRAGEGAAGGPRIKTWLESGEPEACVDLLFVGDGYQRRHLSRSGKYWRDVKRYAKRLFEERPFGWCKKLFNVRAAFVESTDAGCRGASKVADPDTALKSRFVGDRLLHYTDEKALIRIVEAAQPVDVVFVMVNVERYGGAGTMLRGVEGRSKALPAPTFSAQDTTSFMIALHELGHSLADLADEYVEVQQEKRFRLPKGDEDLSFANVTRAAHLDRTSFDTLAATVKWKRFLSLRGAKRWTWAYEGGYYRSRGVFRPFPRCMMNELGDPYCPVCCEAMAKAIHAIAGKPWDQAAYDKAHPLRHWR